MDFVQQFEIVLTSSLLIARLCTLLPILTVEIKQKLLGIPNYLKKNMRGESFDRSFLFPFSIRFPDYYYWKWKLEIFDPKLLLLFVFCFAFVRSFWPSKRGSLELMNVWAKR